jgi:hypothetical protein
VTATAGLATLRPFQDTPRPFSTGAAAARVRGLRMGRETKLLLGLLATLLGVFLGVLSMKLLVPRPPAGAGPDIHADLASTEPQDLVEPPRFDGANAPPGTAATTAQDPGLVTDHGGDVTAASDRVDVVRDPFVSRSSFASPEAASGGDLAPPAADDLAPSSPASQAPPRPADLGSPATAASVASPAAPPPVAGSRYVARDGDSWWSLAETAYGDGRLYRALFAWNRAVDPRVSLVPGTPLELPPRERLQMAWPALVPGP